MLSPGQIQMLLAVFLFSLMGLIVKELFYLGAHQLVLVRAVVIVFFAAIHLMLVRARIFGVDRKKLVLRAFTGTIGLYCFFYTVQVMPLASAVTLQFLSPLFVLLISSLFLKEHSSWKHWLWFMGAFFGVALVKGFDPRVDTFGLSLGLIGALSSGISYNLVRSLRKTDRSEVIVFYFALIAAPLMVPFSFYEWIPMGGYEWGLALLMGAVTYYAQVALTKAFHLERASRISHFIYLGTIFALVYGYFIFGETIPLLSLIGMGLIIFSVLMISRLKS